MTKRDLEHYIHTLETSNIAMREALKQISTLATDGALPSCPSEQDADREYIALVHLWRIGVIADRVLDAK